jgi:hypothetical protein
LVRQQEKKKKMEAMMAERDPNDMDNDSLASSNVLSDKSGSKKSRPNMQDQKSAQSPHA